eukprot:GILJ01007553.1.p1 GENE.GILJ01007553.1~~GILJ01007553.1.p1  ORF type:complete len:229 (+),score=2.04 GILJ01007553.1:144-830(+)
MQRHIVNLSTLSLCGRKTESTRIMSGSAVKPTRLCVLQPTVEVTVGDSFSFFSKDPGLSSSRRVQSKTDSATRLAGQELQRHIKAFRVSKYVSTFQECVENGFEDEFMKDNSTHYKDAYCTSTLPKKSDETSSHRTRKRQRLSFGTGADLFSSATIFASNPSSSSPFADGQRSAPPRVCSTCGVDRTPLWRRSESKLVCNACGLRARLLKSRAQVSKAAYHHLRSLPQ